MRPHLDAAIMSNLEKILWVISDGEELSFSTVERSISIKMRSEIHVFTSVVCTTTMCLKAYVLSYSYVLMQITI